jgi:TCP-1/cpn60 chaperonin family
MLNPASASRSTVKTLNELLHDNCSDAAVGNTRAGDGTTTSTLMTQSIVNNGLRAVTSGANPVEVRRGIMKAAELLVKEIKRVARPVEGIADLNSIATIASGSSVMGAIISQVSGCIAVQACMCHVWSGSDVTHCVHAQVVRCGCKHHCIWQLAADGVRTTL